MVGSLVVDAGKHIKVNDCAQFHATCIYVAGSVVEENGECNCYSPSVAITLFWTLLPQQMFIIELDSSVLIVLEVLC